MRKYIVEYIRPEKVVAVVQAEDTRGAYHAAERGEGEIVSTSLVEPLVITIAKITLIEEEHNG